VPDEYGRLLTNLKNKLKYLTVATSDSPDLPRERIIRKVELLEVKFITAKAFN